MQAGGAILIDLNSGLYYSLNQTGTWLWENLDGRRTTLPGSCDGGEILDLVVRTTPEKAAWW